MNTCDYGIKLESGSGNCSKGTSWNQVNAVAIRSNIIESDIEGVRLGNYSNGGTAAHCKSIWLDSNTIEANDI
jgi:hypothetical protein